MLSQFRIVSILSVALTMMVAAPVWAQQATLPSFTVLDLGPLNLDKGQTVVRDPKTVLNQIENQEMKKTLMLQNQITMINALTNWQSQVSKMEETYTAAGLSFTPPKPPRRICEQVPPNAVCGEAYADLAPAPEVMEAPVIPVSTPGPVIAAPETEKTSVSTEEKEPAPTYSWTDIRCKGNSCSAILIDTTSNTRVSVLEGETIDDRVMVQRITPDSVTLTVAGKAQKLPASDQPAHKFTNSGNASSSQDAAALTDALSQTPPSDNAMEALNQAQNADPIVLDDGTGEVDANADAAAEAAANGMDSAPTGGETGGAGDPSTGLF